MIKIIAIVVGLSFALNVRGQNLVLNPGFDDTVFCPLGPDQSTAAQDWYTPTGTSTDYYNVCSDPYPLGLVGVPFNWVGFQNPRSDGGYMGLAIDFGLLNPNYREYIQTNISVPLTRGHLYHASFFVSLADSSSIAVTELGAMVSETNPGTFGSFIINAIPQVASPRGQYLTNTTDWVEISGYFLAKGNEKYLTIGYFRDNSMSENVKVYNSLYLYQKAYYYIDDVSLTDISGSSFPNIFTPNGDGINDELDLKISCSDCDFELQIYNRWGNLIESTDTFKWNGKHNGEICSEGIYFYIVRDKVAHENLHSGYFLLKKLKT